ncbi:unnamed protein product [Leptosia nina]|uniref:Uncharacterized protein n=1 Tax=Leptosia nina TaxID=320188 RepID=A0AAV1JAQ0_9NEOP
MKLRSKYLSKYRQSVGPRNEIDSMCLPAFLFQSFFGQNVLNPNWTWKKYFVHQLLNLFLFIYVLVGTLECLKLTDDTELEAEAYYTIIMIIIFPIKMVLFINNRFIFRDLYASVKDTLMDVIRKNAEADVKNIIKTGNRIVYLLFCMVILPVSTYELTTLWNYIVGTRILLSRSTMILMPMSTPFYEVAWFLHTIFLFEISSTIILDLWFVLLLFFLCAAFDGLVVMLNGRQNDLHSEDDADHLNKTLRNFYKTHLKLNQ